MWWEGWVTFMTSKELVDPVGGGVVLGGAGGLWEGGRRGGVQIPAQTKSNPMQKSEGVSRGGVRRMGERRGGGVGWRWVGIGGGGREVERVAGLAYLPGMGHHRRREGP